MWCRKIVKGLKLSFSFLVYPATVFRQGSPAILIIIIIRFITWLTSCFLTGLAHLSLSDNIIFTLWGWLYNFCTMSVGPDSVLLWNVISYWFENSVQYRAFCYRHTSHTWVLGTYPSIYVQTKTTLWLIFLFFLNKT